MKRLRAILLLLVISAHANGQQSDAAALERRVMRAVTDTILATALGVRAVLVGTPTVCDAREGAICAGKAYTLVGVSEAARSAQLVADILGRSVSDDTEAEARRLVAPPVFDSSSNRTRWYRRCTIQETGGYALRIRPSAIRRAKGEGTWRVVVTVNAEPLRGECVGGGTTSEYVVVSDARGNYRVAEIDLLGAGTGHVR